MYRKWDLCLSKEKANFSWESTKSHWAADTMAAPCTNFDKVFSFPPKRRAHANQSEFYDTQKNECLWYLMVSCALHPVPQLQHVCKFQNIGHCPTANAGFCLHILIVLLCCSQLDFAAVGVIVSNEKLCLCWSKCCFHWNNGCWGSKVAFSRKKEFLMCLHK